MQLVSFPRFVDVNLDVVSVANLLLHVLVYLRGDLGFVEDLVVQSHDPHSGAIVVFPQIGEVLLVEVLDGDLVVEDVHGRVLHDGLDTLFHGELGEFAAGGGVVEIFYGNGEEELLLDVRDSQGLDEYGVGDVGDQGFCPGDNVGGDGSVNHVVLGQVAQVQSNTLRITFHFRGEH